MHILLQLFLWYDGQIRLLNVGSAGPEGDLRVYLEGLALAENVQEYVKNHPFGQRPINNDPDQDDYPV